MSWLLRYAKVLLVVYCIALAVALFSPTSTDQSGMVYWLVQRLWQVGFSPAFATFTRLEVIMNAVIVAPATFIASLIWRRFNWRDWTAFGFVLSTLVETTQLLALPSRQASFSDVVANTAGACLGAIAFNLVWLALRSLRARRIGRLAPRWDGSRAEARK